MADLTHFDGQGAAHMVDVSEKAVTSRIAEAVCYIKMAQETYDIIVENRAKKGDVLGVARLAGIMGAKKLMISLLKIALKKAMFWGLPGWQGLWVPRKHPT